MFDEADMLLCGSFQNQVIRLIHMLRFDEKQLSQTNKYEIENPGEVDFDSPMNFGLEEEKDTQNESTLEGDEDLEDDAANEDSGEKIEGTINRKDWRRRRKNYERSKQYIFVAATLPSNGKKTAGAVLKRMFPDANWVSGNYLHYHNPRCHF